MEHRSSNWLSNLPLASKLRILIALVLALLLAACDRLAGPSHSAPLRIGMEMKYPPFEMRDEQGEPAGVSVDLGRALGEALQRPVTFADVPFSGLIPALKTGQVDLIISSMTATDERRQSIDFSEPYLRTGLCLLVAAKSKVQTAADLNRPGQTVAVVKATTGHLWATQHLKEARLLVLGEESAAALEVSQGKADAFIYDQMSTLRNWLKYRDSTRAILAPFKEESWAIALAKGNDELRGKVNAFLADHRAKGGFERLGDKWLGAQKAEFKRMNVPFVF
jgi:polar amino acid transport system substrate-binding protein